MRIAEGLIVIRKPQTQVKKILSIFVLLTLFASCQDVEKMEKPKDLISSDKMVDVLVEVSLLQAARNYNKNMLEEKGVDPQNYIWDKYDIDSLQFAQSSQFYAENYRQYEQIYSRAKEQLEGYRVHYDSLEQIKREELDSLREKGDDTPLELKKMEASEDTLQVL